MGRACWWLAPLYELVLGTVLSSAKVFADETTLPVLEPGPVKTKTGRLWCYAVDDRPWAGSSHPAAAYVYSEDRRGEHPTAHLRTFKGILQVDGYAGFSRLVEARRDASIRLAFCWAHARRPFYEFYTSTQSPLAAEVLARIARLYEIEAGICASGRSPAAKSTPGRATACLATGPCAARAGLVRPGESHALCLEPLGRADPVPRRRASGDGQQRRGTLDAADGNVPFIVPPILKCLETLTSDCRNCRDTEEPSERARQRCCRSAGRWLGFGMERQSPPAQRPEFHP